LAREPLDRQDLDAFLQHGERSSRLDAPAVAQDRAGAVTGCPSRNPLLVPVAQPVAEGVEHLSVRASSIRRCSAPLTLRATGRLAGAHRQVHQGRPAAPPSSRPRQRLGSPTGRRAAGRSRRPGCPLTPARTAGPIKSSRTPSGSTSPIAPSPSRSAGRERRSTCVGHTSPRRRARAVFRTASVHLQNPAPSSPPASAASAAPPGVRVDLRRAGKCRIGGLHSGARAGRSSRPRRWDNASPACGHSYSPRLPQMAFASVRAAPDVIRSGNRPRHQAA